MFPFSWVAVSDYEFDDSDTLVSGVIQAICDDNESKAEAFRLILKSNPNIKIYWQRTNDTIGVGLIW